MAKLLAPATLALAASLMASAPASAEVPLPLLAQATGMPSLAPLLDKASPSVVRINVRYHTAPAPKSARADARARASQQSDIRVGSGVVFDGSRGLIITNNHVIEDAEDILVALSRTRRLRASVVGADPVSDLAVIKVPTTELATMTFADSDQLRVGDFVVAIGVPFPIGRSVTSGIVSGLHRSGLGLAEAEDFIQTDAAVYPGDSGGALVNLRGELIGINGGFIASTSTNSGVGFAIPSNRARRVANELITHGEISRGALGITYEDPKLSTPREVLVAPTGPVITKIVPGSSGDRAGIKVGDAVTAIDGITVRDADDLSSRLGLVWLGETVGLSLQRDGQPIDIHAVTEEPTPTPARPPNAHAAQQTSGQHTNGSH